MIALMFPKSWQGSSQKCVIGDCIKCEMIWSWYQIWHEGLAVTFTTDHGIFRALCFSSYHCFVDNVAQEGRAGCKKWKQQQINLIRYCAIYIWTSKRALDNEPHFMTRSKKVMLLWHYLGPTCQPDPKPCRCVPIPDICHFFYTGSSFTFKILHPKIV